MSLTFGSLFAGIGGIDLGFERAGMVCKWQVEIDDYARKVLAKHWPTVRRWDDVRTWPQPDTEYVDCIVGGFPCQDISYAGKGAGLQGERSGLFYEACRIVREMGPRFVVLENVAALLTRGMGDVLGSLASLGFDAEWHCVPAASVGAPHIRDRVFILAYSQHWRLSERRGAAVPTKVDDAGGVCRNVGACSKKQAGSVLADSNNAGLERLRVERQSEKRRSPDGHSRQSCLVGGTGPQHWESEPAVGRVANGVSFGLERFGGLENGKQSSDKKKVSEGRKFAWEVLREVWLHRELAKTSPELFVERLRHLVPDVSCAIGLRKWVKKASCEKELFDMWHGVYAKPFEETEDLQQSLLERAREAERAQTLGLKRARVDRLRGLGNAVVPQVAEFIGRKLMERVNDTTAPI